MMRPLASAAVLILLAACSLNPFRSGHGAKVIAESQYCGTASQDSEAHYFGSRQDFQDWIKYRSIREFEPSLATNAGVIVVEMGQRPTGGYKVKLDDSKTKIEGGTLTLGMIWSAPRLDAAVSQALIASCVVIQPPQGDYNRIRVVDQLGNVRGEAQVR